MIALNKWHVAPMALLGEYRPSKPKEHFLVGASIPAMQVKIKFQRDFIFLSR